MNLKNELDSEEIKLLASINIQIIDKHYSIDDTADIIEKLDDEIHNNLDKKLNFTPKAVELEKIQDKILQLEDKIN